jgi:DNA-binding transcriptional MerR regulator
MRHLEEIKKIISDYNRIRKSLSIIEEQTRLLTLQKNQVELELVKLREAETLLIDKIKSETGQSPDFYKIIQELNEESGVIG